MCPLRNRARGQNCPGCNTGTSPPWEGELEDEARPVTMAWPDGRVTGRSKRDTHPGEERLAEEEVRMPVKGISSRKDLYM